jgi:sucrose-6F-phosphate phosphohydrolase
MKKPKALLASDMDGTVIPLEVNKARRAEIQTFKRAVERRSDLGLAYVTGRHLALAMDGIRQHLLPEPDTLVCDVGTSVYHSTSEGYETDREYAYLMEEARGGVDVREVRQELGHLSHLTLQPEDRQTESKLSYHLSPGSDHRAVVSSVEEILDDMGGRLQAVYSVGAPRGTGLLDLLPAGVAKDFAIRYLHQRSGVEEKRVVYAGDSGNDLAAMLVGFRTIVVGNATPGLKEQLTVRGRELGILDRIFFAQGFYVAGVLEGCRHHGIL